MNKAYFSNILFATILLSKPFLVGYEFSKIINIIHYILLMKHTHNYRYEEYVTRTIKVLISELKRET